MSEIKSDTKNDIYEVMKKYGQMMTSQGYPVGSAKMMIQSTEGVFATREGADLANLQQGDIQKLEMEKLPLPLPEMKSVVYSQTPFCQKALREAEPFRAKSALSASEGIRFQSGSSALPNVSTNNRASSDARSAPA